MTIKNIITFCFLLASQILYANNLNNDITDYIIRADYNNTAKTLNVNLQMKIDKLHSGKIDLIFTHFAKISSLNIQEGKSKISLDYQFFSTDSIRLILPEKVKTSKKQTITFEYSFPIDSVSGSKSGIYTFSRADKWYPLQYNDLSTHTIIISVPDNFTSLSTGDIRSKVEKLGRKTYSWLDKYNFTCPLFIFESTSLKFITKTTENKNINFYFYTKDTLVQNKFIDIVCASFTYFYNFFDGDYPYSTYSFIEIPDYQAGSATGSLQVFGTPLISDCSSNGLLECLKPASHEVAHEWWGIGRLHFKDKTKEEGLQFLRESVNEYLNIMFIGQYWGADSLTKCLQIALSYYKQYINIDNEKVLIEIPQQFITWEEAVVVYYKGALIVHELRKMLGDKKWEEFLKKYYSKYKNKYSTYNDFIITLSQFDKKGAITTRLNNYLKTKGFQENKLE